MKSIIRLTRGEIVKMLKSNTLYIMAGALAVLIAVMSILYATQKRGVTDLFNLLIGGTRVDSFDIMEGNFEEISDVIDPSMLEEFTTFKLDDPRLRLLMLCADPVITESLPSLVEAFTGQTPVIPELSALTELHSTLYGNYFRNYLGSDDAYLYVVDMQMDYFKAHIDAGDPVGFADFIEMKILEAGTLFEELDAAFKHYNAEAAKNRAAEEGAIGKDALIKNETAAYSGFRSSLSAFSNIIGNLRFYTSAELTGTNYIYLPTNGKLFGDLDYEELTYALRNAERVLMNVRDDLSRIYSAYNKANTLKNFTAEFLGRILLPDEYAEGAQDSGRTDRVAARLTTLLPAVMPALFPDSDVDAVLSYLIKPTIGLPIPGKTGDLGDKLINDFNTVPLNITKNENDFLYGYSEVMAQLCIDNPKDTKAIEFTERFKGGKLAPFIELLHGGYEAPVTASIYNKYFEPYYDRSEREEIAALRQSLNGYTAEYSAAQIIMSLVPDLIEGSEGSIGFGDFEIDIPKIAADGVYANIKSAFKQFDSKSMTLYQMTKNVCAKNTFDYHGLNDSQVREIRGFLLSSRYSINSDIAKAQFLIDQSTLAREYSAPENMSGAYGYMSFVFLLTGIVILIFGIVLAAGTIAGEHSDGTMKLLLIRPHTRWQVLLSKFLAVFIVLLAFYLVNFLLTFLIGGIGWGFTAPNALAIFNGTKIFITGPLAMTAIFQLFSFVEAAIFALVALTISTVFKARSGAISISMLIYFVSFVLGTVLSAYDWYKYILFNNTNLSIYFGSVGPSLADMTLWFSLIVDLIYTAVLGTVCFFTFAKRDAT